MEKLTKVPEEAVPTEKTLRSDVPADEIDEIESDEETDSGSNSDSSSDSDSDSEFECEVCKKTFSSYSPLKQHLKGKKHAKAVLRKKKEKKLMKGDEVFESDEEHLVEEAYAKCEACKKEFFGPESYEQHLKCKKHKKKMLEASILEQVRVEGKINPDKLRDLCKTKRNSESSVEDTRKKTTSLTLEDENENKQDFECKDCGKIFSGLTPYTQHLMSKVHAKTVEKKNLLHKVVPDTSEDDKTPVKSEHDDTNTLCLEDDILVCKACSTSFSGPENAMTHMKSKKHAKKLEKYIRKLQKKKEKKVSKEADLTIDKESNVTENENKEEERKENPQPSPSGFSKLDASNSCTDSSAKETTSSNQVNEGLIAFEKYKEYKTLMNSLQEDKMLK